MWIGPAQGDRAGVLRGFIQDPANELPRIPIPRTPVNRDAFFGIDRPGPQEPRLSPESPPQARSQRGCAFPSPRYDSVVITNLFLAGVSLVTLRTLAVLLVRTK